MEPAQKLIETQYKSNHLLEAIQSALRKAGKDPGNLQPADLTPVDAFHIRGRQATIELADLASLKPGTQLLDVGCRLGGSARYLASEYQCDVTGVDLISEYVDTAKVLTRQVGLDHLAKFQQVNALSLPFEDEFFDVVWTEHAQMNIADKHGFYGEIARVLKPQGRLLFHDIFQGNGGPIYFPVPWADDETVNFLITPESAKDVLESSKFSILHWAYKSRASLDWFEAMLEKLKSSGPPLLGTHLLIGGAESAEVKLYNQIRNIRENRMVIIQGLAEKR